MAYYFLISQLPSLRYGQTAPFSPVEFRSLCQTALSASDAKLLNLCSLDPDPALTVQCKFIEQWCSWERAVRLNVARYRASKLKRDSAIDAPEYPASAVAAAKTAVAFDSPLDAEIFLDEVRWKTIEDLQGLDYFSVNVVYAYLLKLLLMERRSLFVTEEGFAEYKKLYDTVMSKNS
ncbi:hypothetical protein FACS1894172_14130 [Spirochaetia bacterium]|nr:hypothetical protein FACS1894164_17760 [Spirochaetia bacterium]GHU34201.1 hypothetical protein FACS1894172_14130 [Spirochaetia bacterium]